MIVDPHKTYYTRVDLPQDGFVKDLLVGALRSTLEQATAEGRAPVQVEIVIRVAPNK